ncbi:glucosamine-6-phosphate deaminase [Clostridium pasteurianum]|uniref:Glucosamine-6-phosphate deaminase n=1 Tax=Clostridium pasteurianum BC1 TaxID=86416 RepID=R4K7T0_CLOPA|nr:glucosamine-6-phosphate deaminase [Clostridium pasteurianum]AGK95700.1 glucosamine-6-phosphate isomerase [Clostridium pasteurianum BC1]
MKIIKADNYEHMSKMAARTMASQIALKNNSVIGLATGDTPLGMYRELIKIYEDEELDFSNIKTFNLDEYYGLNIDNENSYYFYMMNNFFKHINMRKENINIPNGMTENIEAECFSYDKKIKASGGIDIQVLGIGVNGHIGFNEPNTSFEVGTHLVELEKETIKSNSRFFNSPEEVPTKAISMGIKTIMQSRAIMLLASGEKKAAAIEKAVKGKISTAVPASILQLHNNVTLIVDKAAGEFI